MWENVQCRIEGLLVVLVESFGPKMMLMLGCLVQTALDVCVGWDLESPHLEEVSQTLQNLPQLHRRQPERPKGF